MPGAHAHVFVADVEAPEIETGDRHHLERALRVQPDEVVTAADGAGRWRQCHLVGGRLEPAGEVVTEERAVPLVTVAFAPTKGDRPEWAVQKLTELGVDSIVVFMAARSVVRWSGDRATAATDRLRRVAREAAMQSRRTWLPTVGFASSFSEVTKLADPTGVPMANVAMADISGAPPTLAFPTVLVGPEGGWHESELDAGLARVSLGPQVLRSETAAVTAGALLCALRAGIVAPASNAASSRPGAVPDGERPAG